MIQKLAAKPEDYVVTQLLRGRIRRMPGGLSERFTVTINNACLFVRGTVNTYLACQMVEDEIRKAAREYRIEALDIDLNVTWGGE